MNTKFLRMLFVCKFAVLSLVLNAQVFETKILGFEINYFPTIMVDNYSLSMSYEVKNISNQPQKYIQKSCIGHSKYDSMKCDLLNECSVSLVDSLKKEIRESKYLENMAFVFQNDTVCVTNAWKYDRDTVYNLQPNEAMRFDITTSSRQIGLLFYCKHLYDFWDFEKFMKCFLSVGLCVGKNQMCHLCGWLYTLTHNARRLGVVRGTRMFVRVCPLESPTGLSAGIHPALRQTAC